MTDRLDEHQKRLEDLEDLIDKLEREDGCQSQSACENSHSYSRAATTQVFFPPSQQVPGALPSRHVSSGMIYDFFFFV